uniref:Uncharacterized protein n=1 Tax=Steinernema glaseri TaxID=37863 RepID=A0A1I8AHL4_9BILA
MRTRSIQTLQNRKNAEAHYRRTDALRRDTSHVIPLNLQRENLILNILIRSGSDQRFPTRSTYSQPLTASKKLNVIPEQHFGTALDPEAMSFVYRTTNAQRTQPSKVGSILGRGPRAITLTLRHAGPELNERNLDDTEERGRPPAVDGAADERNQEDERRGAADQRGRPQRSPSRGQCECLREYNLGKGSEIV